ncbi:hypothetical protein FGO68_gene141 [Halteria grandinella]|uniref:Lysozyme n=1 Tax=Halteria grandinella TaxID=5974 RepID=A0A8J8NJH0_HALGN|nr:hypothetical protein FGO68_gene141 [Halteria grandinella]
MKWLLVVASILAIVISKRGADFGPDWANNFSVQDLQCLKSTGIEFLIIRGWQKYGAMDNTTINAHANANKVGFDWVDTYLFPCRTMNATDQVNQLVANLTQAKAQFGKIWLDVEINPWPGCGWDTFSFESNCEFLKELVQAVRNANQTVGIYSSHYEWTSLFGTDTACSHFTDVPLWYAHFDSNKTFDDYYRLPFGGWTKPMIKQYIDLTRNTVCGFTIDQDYIPDVTESVQ